MLKEPEDSIWHPRHRAQLQTHDNDLTPRCLERIAASRSRAAAAVEPEAESAAAHNALAFKFA